MTSWYPYHPGEVAMRLAVDGVPEDWSYVLLKNGRYVNRWASPEYDHDPEVQRRREATERVIRMNIALDRADGEQHGSDYYEPSSIDERFHAMVDRADGST